MVKKEFDTLLTPKNLEAAKTVVLEAEQEGVEKIINVGTSLIESKNCILLAQENANTYATIGIHPSDCAPSWNKELKKIMEYIKNKKESKIIAIGECGIDLYHQKHNVQQQKDLFKAQIELSLEHDLPLTIHMRDATDEVASCLEAFKNEQLKGVIHCFSEDQPFANHIFELGLSIGIGGAITYPNNEALRNVVLKSPLSNIILETDAPFLAPQIIRGKPNHPKYINDIAKYIANLKQVSFDYIAEQTTNNALKLFEMPETND